MNRRTLWAAAAVGVALAGGFPARADVTAEALLKVLVRKGVLTQAEADDVRAEAERETVAEDATHKQLDALKATVDKAGRTQFSGYIQVRAVAQEHGSPRNNIVARRARFTVKHANGPARFQLTLDGGQNDVTSKDAWLSYMVRAPRNGRGALDIKAGQFLRPFGFEIERSSTIREFPERPAGWLALFPGIFDLGASASFALDADTGFTLALMNGTGAGTASTPKRDTDGYKDVLARARHTLRNAEGLPAYDLSLSAYKGRQRTTTAPAITGDRDRYGLGAVAYNVAGGEARAEYIRARDLTLNLSGGPALATAPAEAWYLLYTHPVGGGVRLGARYDAFDPDTKDERRPGGDGEIRTLGFVALRDLTENARLTLAYEMPQTTRYDAARERATRETNGVLTLQGQYKF